MELKLEHLAHYFPFDLRCKILNYKSDYVGREYGHIEGYYFLAGKCHYMFGGKSEAGKTSDLFMPILTPFSDFEKVIAKDLMNRFNCSLKVIEEIWKLKQGEIKIEDITCESYLMMCENHIDFNNLISEGLAISIHDINQ